MIAKKETDFGFTKVEYKEKQGLVNGVFESVSSKYDIMNDLMSFGLHRLWKKHFLGELKVKEGSKLLDLAAGSGDISFSYLSKADAMDVNVECVITDVNPHMLKIAEEKAIDKGLKTESINFLIVNAEEIPFEDNSFDLCTISFGIRNVTDIPKALSEIHRVLKPGGKFVCLEFSQMNSQLLQKIYDEYSFRIIPKMGKIVAGDLESYQYLVESIRKFPMAEIFRIMLEEAGFSKTSFEKLTHGVVAIHKGWKI